MPHVLAQASSTLHGALDYFDSGLLGCYSGHECSVQLTVTYFPARFKEDRRGQLAAPATTSEPHK
jgi:hypothetical protein